MDLFRFGCRGIELPLYLLPYLHHYSSDIYIDYESLPHAQGEQEVLLSPSLETGLRYR